MRVIIAGKCAWADKVAALIEREGHTVLRYDSTIGYVSRLVDDRASLILVAGNDARWAFWTTTPKSSPATRRIPVIVVMEDLDQRAEAARNGADFALSRSSLVAELPSLLRKFARTPDAALTTELDCQCGEPMPAEGLQAIALFNAGNYYQQHDLFEALWMAEPGPVRNLYQAILQVGVAYYQITRGNARGAVKMLLRSMQWLSDLPDQCRGVDVAWLRADVAVVRKELERVGEHGLADFDGSLLRGVLLVSRSQDDDAT